MLPYTRGTGRRSLVRCDLFCLRSVSINHTALNDKRTLEAHRNGVCALASPVFGTLASSKWPCKNKGDFVNGCIHDVEKSVLTSPQAEHSLVLPEDLWQTLQSPSLLKGKNMCRRPRPSDSQTPPREQGSSATKVAGSDSAIKKACQISFPETETVEDDGMWVRGGVVAGKCKELRAMSRHMSTTRWFCGARKHPRIPWSTQTAMSKTSNDIRDIQIFTTIKNHVQSYV